eukprot:18353_1
MGNATTIEGCIGKLKVEDYPNDIKEEEWIATGLQETTKEDQEVLISKGNDRRVRAMPKHYKKYTNNKLICICGQQLKQKINNNIFDEKKIMCICGKKMEEELSRHCSKYGITYCNQCRKWIDRNRIAYHCSDIKSKNHTTDYGYNVCIECSKS